VSATKRAEVSFYVKPLYALPSDKVLWIGGERIALRDFQAELYEELLRRARERIGVFLEAPTGSGKTYTLLTLLALKQYRGVVAVYPTKTLAKDQYDSIYNKLEGGREVPLSEIGISRSIRDLLESDVIRKIFEERGLPTREQDFITLKEVKVVTPEGAESTRRVLMLLATSETTEVLKLLLGKETKRETFLELADSMFLKVDFVVLFTVPEYPYTIHEMAYGEFEREGEKLWRAFQHYKKFLEVLAKCELTTDNSECFERIAESLREAIDFYRRELGVTRSSLQEVLDIHGRLLKHPLFIDEFHLYSDLSELSLLALLFMYYAFYPYAKAIFSSATPNERLQKLIEVLHNLFEVRTIKIKAGTSDVGEREHLIRGKTKVTFYGANTGTGGYAGLLRAQRFIPEVAYEIAGGDPNKKTMAVLDRVGLVLDTCKRIRDAVGEGKELIYVTSVKVPTEYCREVNVESLKKGDYDYIVGNLAIAQGVDLKHIERGIVYAKDITSFIQRFGRVPRGRDGEVYVIVEWKRLGKVKDLNGKLVSYQDFIKYLKEQGVFPDPAEISWLESYLGFVKLTFPMFVHVLRSAVAYTDARGTEYDKLAKALPKLVRFIQEYFKLFKPAESISKFLELISQYVDSKLFGSYTTFYKLMSFRDIPSAKIEVASSKGVYLKEQSIAVSLRNFLMEKEIRYRGAVIRVNLEKRNLYLPLILAEVVYKDDEKKLLNCLKPLNDAVISFELLLDKLSTSSYDFYLVQLGGDGSFRSSIRVSELRNRIANKDLATTPVLLRVGSGNSSFEDYAFFMAYTREALPIGIYRRGTELRIIGLAVLL